MKYQFRWLIRKIRESRGLAEMQLLLGKSDWPVVVVDTPELEGKRASECARPESFEVGFRSSSPTSSATIVSFQSSVDDDPWYDENSTAHPRPSTVEEMKKEAEEIVFRIMERLDSIDTLDEGGPEEIRNVTGESADDDGDKRESESKDYFDSDRSDEEGPPPVQTASSSNGQPNGVPLTRNRNRGKVHLPSIMRRKWQNQTKPPQTQARG